MHKLAPASRSLIEKVSIAAPCSVSWETMVGDETKRLCGGCSKDVYNLSAMSQSEAESLLRTAAEMPCLKFYRRQDGTIMFDNCPKALRKLRDAAKSTWKIASVFLAFCVSSISAFAEEQSNETPPSNFNFTWTLTEAGPTERGQFPITKPKPVPTHQLAQLGGGDRYFLFGTITPGTQTQGIGADWSGADAFSEALKLAQQKKFDAAQKAFDKALIATSKAESDPMYREFIGSEYAKVLTRVGKKSKARQILAETKATATIARKQTQP